MARFLQQLLPSQKKQVIAILISGGLSPEDFEWIQPTPDYRYHSSTGHQLRHRVHQEFHFAVFTDYTTPAFRYCPGIQVGEHDEHGWVKATGNEAIWNRIRN